MNSLHEECFVTDVININELVPFLTRERKLDYETLTEEKLNEVIPPGWRCFYKEITRAVEKFQVKVGKIEVNHGMLVLQSTSDNELDDMLFKRYADNLRYHASKICMMCGGYGWRRVDINFKPIFCNKHYLEFINIEEFYV